MVYDVKVFDAKGKLIEIINGQKSFDAHYAKIIKSIKKTAWGKHAKNYKKAFICPICKKEVEGRINQVTCGSRKCLRERQQIKKLERNHGQIPTKITKN